MAQTIISQGDAFAIKYYGAALFAEAIRRSKFRNNLRGPAPKQARSVAKMRTRSMQSSPDMPIVSITDLNRAMGDTVSIDMFGALVGMPIMGDEKISGRGIPLKRSSMDLHVDQMRQLTDPGGRMTQHRTRYDLREVARANLAEWFGRLLNQLCHIHMAGARGSHSHKDWCIPLQTHDDFDKIVVNKVRPPTRNRRFFAGDATGLASLAATDALTLDEISRIRVAIDEMAFPPSPIKLPGDEASDDEDPMYLMYVSPRQWYYLENASKLKRNDYRSFLQNALSRGRFVNHPLFKSGGGSMGMWANILIRKLSRPIRFQTTDSVKEYNSSDVETDVTPAVETERAIILGGQALAEAWGNARPAGDDAPARWVEEWTDHRNSVEISGALIGGYSKIRFVGTDDEPTDFGIMTVDSYAPAPNTTAGNTLLSVIAD